MTLNFDSDELHSGIYTIYRPVVKVQEVNVIISIRVDMPLPDWQHPKFVDNIMCIVNGRVVEELYWFDSTMHSREWVGGAMVPGDLKLNNVFTIPRIHFRPGRNEITLSLWNKEAKPLVDEGCYIETTVEMEPLQTKTLTPGVIQTSMFYLDYLDAQIPANLEEIREAGITALEGGIFLSPADNLAIGTYEKWQIASLTRLRQQLEFCADNGFKLVGTGDDLFRSAAEQAAWATYSWLPQAVKETFETLRDHRPGVCVGIRLFDETPPAFYATPVGQAFMEVYNEVQGAPPISWPNVGWNEPDEAPPIAGFVSRYLQNDVAWRNTREDGPSAWEVATYTGRNYSNWSPVLPFAAFGGAMGIFYVEQNAVPGYQQGADRRLAGSAPLRTYLMQPWAAACFVPFCMYNVYGWDDLWKQYRSTGQLGEQQTGSMPGDERWPWIKEMFKSLRDFGSKLLLPWLSPIVADDWLIGRRRDADGVWHFAVNISSIDQESPIGEGLILGPTRAMGRIVPADGGVLVQVDNASASIGNLTWMRGR